MSLDSPINLSAADRAELERLLQSLPERSAGVPTLAADVQGLVDLAQRLIQDIDDLSLMHGAVVEHSTGLENELSRSNERVSSMIESMRRYLSAQLFQRIMGGTAEVSAGSHQRRNLTVFFSDIVGFTELTDTVEPEMLSQMLNSYLDEMASICDKWGGTIDKFIGDAVMIYFGDEEQSDPVDGARRCVCMALEMQSCLGLLEERWRHLGSNHRLRIRVGINSGYCTVGNFGSSSRVDYTIVGGNVNVASRLEHQCAPGGILISGSTYALVRELVEVRSVGHITVKGVAHPIETFEVMARRDSVLDDTNPMLLQHDEGFDLRNIHFDARQTPAIEREAIVSSLRRALALLEQSGHTSG
ncbi:MAG: adenylate/guanylate cyclase domain-containing protein [Xanthomonadales bacterium]|nr:adenylate/guanylate cyclase domain-containing protein [Xanthomonadales bacterium]MCB1627972.1 adenylate/guanylate cyclase domain-containing protein [Xanthomonadales bacterium]